MRRMNTLSTPNIAQGQLAVYRVVSELIARGHAPYLPVVDSGIDILLGSGIRLQVKSTQRPTQHWRQAGAWSFTLRASQRIVKQKYVKSATRQFSREVDFVILHGIEGNRFWIVPAHILDKRTGVMFKDGHKQWKDCDETEAKRLRAEGLSFQAIADQLGVSHHTVMRRIKGIGSRNNRNYADIPQYENRWDLVGSAAIMLREANQIVSQTGGSPSGHAVGLTVAKE